MSVFDHLVEQAIGSDKSFGNASDPAQNEYPALWHWLTNTAAGVDHLKEPAKLSVRACPGGFFVSLSDDAFGVSIDASCEQLTSVFEAIEKALQAPQPAIRTWPNHEPKLRKKKAVK